MKEMRVEVACPHGNREAERSGLVWPRLRKGQTKPDGNEPKCGGENDDGEEPVAKFHGMTKLIILRPMAV